jgi:F-type H+-transporting ATPase subunit b
MLNSFAIVTTAAAEGGGFNPLDPSGAAGLLWTVVIFLLSLPLIWKYVMGPITRALEERDDLARRAIDQATKASQDAEAARAEVEVKLGEARAEASQLLADARERAETREREIVEEAKRSAEGLVENARTQIQAEQEKALAAIRNEVVDLSLTAATQVLGRQVGSEDDRRLVGELVDSAGAARS